MVNESVEELRDIFIMVFSGVILSLPFMKSSIVKLLRGHFSLRFPSNAGQGLFLQVQRKNQPGRSDRVD